MARPITWQDVAGPAQTPGLLLAGQQAGRQVVDAFTGLGDTFRNIGDVQKKAATDAAVASVANAADPTVAAAAIPQGWQFDPLAIAVAANARKEQLGRQELQTAQLESTKVQTNLSRLTLEDRESEQDIASRLLPVYDDAIKGSPIEKVVDLNDPFYKTKAGLTFIEKYNDYFRQGEEQRNEQEQLKIQRGQLRLQGIQARAAQQQLNMAISRQTADDKYAAWRQTSEGAKADLAEQQRMGRIIGVQNGAGEAYGTVLPEKWASARGRATEAEKDRPTNLGLTGRELIAQQQSRVATAEAVEASTLASWEPLLKLGQQYDTNPFQGAEDFTSVKKVRELVEGFEGNDWLTSRYEDNDIIERVDQIVDWSIRNETPIEKDQAWMIVGKTLGTWTGGVDKTDRIINDEVKRDIKLFDDFNKNGRTAGVQVQVNQQKAKTDKVRQDASRAATIIEGSIIGGGQIPEDFGKELRKQNQKGASASY